MRLRLIRATTWPTPPIPLARAGENGVSQVLRRRFVWAPRR